MKYPATCTVHCPSKPTNACEEHAEQIMSIMRMLGTHVTATVLREPAECDNCVNENRVANSKKES